jgi:SNF2 family DNA or RNA helicase
VLTQLPEKVCEYVECKMTSMQKSAYDVLVSDFKAERQAKSAAMAASHTASSAASAASAASAPVRPRATEMTNLLKNLLMQLRKMANHPLLHRRYFMQRGVAHTHTRTHTHTHV